MPYELAAAQDVTITKESNVDSFTVQQFTIEPGEQTIRIRWSLGKKDAGGTEVSVGTYAKSFDISSYASQSPDGSKTWYANLKAIVYKILLDNGELPSGGTVA